MEDFSLSKPPRALGWRSIQGETGQGDKARWRDWGPLFNQGDLRKPQLPSAGRVWTLLCLCSDAPLPPFLDISQALGPSPSAPPTGLSLCPELRLQPLLQASAGIAGARASSEGCLGSFAK